MLQNPNPQTSLARGVGPTLTTNWLARGWKYSATIRQYILNGFGIFLSLVALSLWTKSLGGAWALVSWTIGGGLLILAISVGLPFGAVTTPPAWFIGFIRKQAGGTPGLSAEDGFNGGWDFVKGLWGAIKKLLFYTPLVFFGIGLFRVEDNLFGVIPFLGVALALIVHYAGTEGTFFRNLVVLIYTGIIVWFLGTWIPPVAERQQQFAHWWTLNVSRNPADKASAEQDADQHAKNVLTANTCFANLKKMTQPTQEDKDRCEALRKSVGSYVYKNAAERARAEANAMMRQARVDAAATCWQGITPKSTPEAVARCEALDRVIDPAPITAAPAATPPTPQGTGTATGTAIKTATADPSAWTCTPWKEFTYNVQNQTRIQLPVGPGRYELTFTGTRQHVFHRKVVVDGRETERDERYATCQIDADGTLANCTDMAGSPLADFTVKHEEQSRYLGHALTTPDLKAPYGKLVVKHDGKTAVIGSQGRFEVKAGTLVVDLNVDRYSLNYGGGTDERYNYRGILSRCEAT